MRAKNKRALDRYEPKRGKEVNRFFFGFSVLVVELFWRLESREERQKGAEEG